MRISLNHYSLNMALSRWPLCRSLHSCNRNGKNVTTSGSISLQIPRIHSWIRYQSSTSAGRIPYGLLLKYLQRKYSGSTRSVEKVGQGRQKYVTVFEIWKPALPMRGALILTVVMHSEMWSDRLHTHDLHALSQDGVLMLTNISHRGQHFALPPCLILHYQITLFGDTSKARHMKQVSKQRIWECIRRTPEEMLKVLWHLFHRDCRNVSKDKVVIWKVSCLDSND